MDVTPTQLAQAAVLTQFSIIAILAVAAMMYREGYSPTYQHADSRNLLTRVLLLFLVTLGPVLLSDALTPAYGPLLGNARLPAIPTSLAMLIVFLADISFIYAMVSWSGGAKDSVFSPVFLMLPTFAIFLREPTWRVFVYTALVAWLTFYNIREYNSGEHPGSDTQGAFLFTTLATLLLGTLLGLGTTAN